MKKYDVYGIGNALVDIVIEVDDAYFEKNEIEKGMMTLVEEDRQKSLIEQVNIEEEMMACGGSAANSIIAVSQFGGKSFYSCKVANDFHGKFYLDDLVNSGVGTNQDLAVSEEGTTGKCLVMVSPDAQRTMNTYLGITADYSKDLIDEKSLMESKYLYMEGYLVTSDNGVEAMLTAKKLAEKHGVKTSLTFSDPSMAKYFGENLEKVLEGGVDLLFCNEEEALTFTGKTDLKEAVDHLLGSAKTIVVTKGEKGASVFDSNGEVIVPAFEAKAIDTNGAGDMFAGAFLYGINNGLDNKTAGVLASKASASVVSQFGPRLKTQQAKNILSEVTN